MNLPKENGAPWQGADQMDVLASTKLQHGLYRQPPNSATLWRPARPLDQPPPSF